MDNQNNIFTKSKYLISCSEFTSVDSLFNVLKNEFLTYSTIKDLSLIEDAFVFADSLHKNQNRKSGEAFIIHPISVAIILAQLKLDKTVIIAGLLHDIIEDTHMTYKDISLNFGDDVAFLVEGVTKSINNIYKADDKIENYRKLFLAVGKDIRIILIKLADRLHNMRTLKYQSRKKQIEIAQETLDIYIPISLRLGIYIIKRELENLCFFYLQPDTYKKYTSNISYFSNLNIFSIKEIYSLLNNSLAKENIHCEVNIFLRDIFSIYRKNIIYNKIFNDATKTFYIHIKTKSEKECYLVLKAFHKLFKPVMSEFRDYISTPKCSYYKALHTTLVNDNFIFEVRIQDSDMMYISEYGITARYTPLFNEPEEILKEDNNFFWLEQILKWQLTISNNKDFFNIIKSYLSILDKNIYCFTVNGDVLILKINCTISEYMKSLITYNELLTKQPNVNGNPVSFNYVLKSGDIIDFK